MSDKKHIDRIFQEKLKDFEASPNPKVWKNIQNQLNQQEPKTKPIWLRYAAVAALLVLLVSVSTVLITNQISTNKTTNTKQPSEINNNAVIPEKQNTTITTVNTKEAKPNNSTSEEKSSSSSINNTVNDALIENKSTVVSNNSTTKETDPTARYSTQNKVSINSDKTANRQTTLNKTKSKSNNSITSSSKNQSSKSEEQTIRSNKVISSNSKRTIADSNGKDVGSNTDTSISKNSYTTAATTDSNNTSTTETTFDYNKNIVTKTSSETNNTAVADSLLSKPLKIDESLTIEAAIALAELKNSPKEEKLKNRWQVYPNIAPVYYNSLGKGSHLDDQFVSNNKSGEVNTSYGISVSYALSKKFAIRSGFNKLNLSYDTDGVILYETPGSGNPVNPLRNITLSTGNETLSALSMDNLGVQTVDDVYNYNAAISQRISYYEIPLEAQYKLVNNTRFGFNIIGGFSSFLLRDNQVYSEFDDYKTYIGEANNINDMSFSGNLGFGITYKFSEKFKFNLEPTFKYQFNAFDNTSGNFKPYIIGAYTGFSYRF
ncbi:outer membrane beta-barrel protein [Corallibacter sp.]|uniref:outer membrane beta-barrel protein n=1 Tax=Corallibacter sp. TaxID=2038084 RepID=UPI003A8DB97D